MGPSWYGAAYTTMDDFARQVSTLSDRPFLNQTGLAGTYSIQLHGGLEG